MCPQQNTYKSPFPPIVPPAQTPAKLTPTTPTKRVLQDNPPSSTGAESATDHGLSTLQKSSPAQHTPSKHQTKTRHHLPRTPPSIPRTAVDSDFPYQQVDNFFARGGRTVLITGESTAIEQFQNFVQQGNYRRSSPGVGEEALLQALELSLRDLHERDETPGVEQMRAMLRDENFAEVVDAFTFGESDCVAGSTAPVIVRALLNTVGSKMHEVYQLGQVTFDPMLQGYRVELDRTVPQLAVTKTVWLHNDTSGDCTEVPAETRWHGFTKDKVAVKLEELGEGSDNAVVSGAGEAAGDDAWKIFTAGADQLSRADREEDVTKQSLGGTVTSAKTPNEEEAVRISNVSGKKPVRNGVTGAPPADTDLPWSDMGGITSDEILAFFPNHALHWPAMSARLIEDGWTVATIAKYINMNRSVVVTSSGPSSVNSEPSSVNNDSSGQGKNVGTVDTAMDAVVTNTILATTCKGCGLFYGVADWKSKSWQNTMALRTDEGVAELIEKMRTTKWKRVKNPRQPKQALNPAWSLKKLGEYFLTNSGVFPCEGDFTRRVAAATRGDAAASTAAAQSKKGLNPPRLPNGWEPYKYKVSLPFMPKPTAGKRPHDDSTDVQPTPQAKRFQLRLTGKAPQMIRENLPANIRDNADAIIREYPESIADELLLWILSTYGGGKTTVEVLNALNKRAEEEFKANPAAYKKAPTVDRSTISYRKRTALQNRAKVNKTSYDFEFAAFEDEIQQAPGRGAPRPLRQNGAQNVSTSSGLPAPKLTSQSSVVSKSEAAAGAYPLVCANGVDFTGGVSADCGRQKLGNNSSYSFDDIPESYVPAVGYPRYGSSPVSPPDAGYQMSQEIVDELVAYNRSHAADLSYLPALSGHEMISGNASFAPIPDVAPFNFELGDGSAGDTELQWSPSYGRVTGDLVGTATQDCLSRRSEMVNGASEDATLLSSAENSDEELRRQESGVDNVHAGEYGLYVTDPLDSSAWNPEWDRLMNSPNRNTDN